MGSLADQAASALAIVNSTSTLDSNKTEQLSHLLRRGDTDEMIVECFVSEKGWNHEVQRFDGAPDWDAIRSRLDFLHARSSREQKMHEIARSEIIAGMLEAEVKCLPQQMETLEGEHAHIRNQLVDWMVKKAWCLRVSTEALFLAKNYLDRFLAMNPATQECAKPLASVGIACIRIAAKHDETYFPCMRDCVEETNGHFQAREVLDMERDVLASLHFRLASVTAYTFVRMLSAELHLNNQVQHLSEFIAELSLSDTAFILETPSSVAISAIYLAMHTLDPRALGLLQGVVSNWGLPCDSIDSCCRRLHVTYISTVDKARPFLASFCTYGQASRSSVSLLEPNREVPPVFQAAEAASTQV